MGIPTFNQGYPPDGSSLGQTKKTIRDNLDGTFLTLGVDHINNNAQPGAKPAGYHTVVHMVPQAANPATIAGYGQLFSKTVNADQALFWKTGNGLVQQLTTNITPSAATNGYTFLPGGLILQWGSATRASGVPVVFTVEGDIKFPNNCFSVQATVQSNSSSRRFIYTSGYLTTQFIPTIIDASGSTSSATFTWWAIGN